MGKETLAASAVLAASAATSPNKASSFDLSLDEFCRRLSVASGPEMVGGFYQSQKAAKKFKSTESDFKQAFDAFAKQPA